MLVKNTIYQQKDRLKFIVSNASEVSREIPQILEYIESEESTNLEDILINAHLQGYQFIIESTWDWGMIFFFLKKMRIYANCKDLVHMRLMKLLNGLM